MVTKEAVHFAFQREDTEIDHIPLAEIVVINATMDSDLGAELNDKGLQDAEAEHTIHITTETGGHNSGRSYYLRADSTEKIDSLVQSVRRLAREAKKRRDNHNIFQRTQCRVRRVYESTPSRAIIIVLIAMVTQATQNSPSTPEPSDARPHCPPSSHLQIRKDSWLPTRVSQSLIPVGVTRTGASQSPFLSPRPRPRPRLHQGLLCLTSH